MTLKDLARSRGKLLRQLGIHQVYASQINSGVRRAGACTLQKIADALGLTTADVAAACDAAWQAKQRSASPDAPAVDPSANGAQVVHAANSTDGVAP
jgi:transcriptional regulator with XRE-family HTH domain